MGKSYEELFTEYYAILLVAECSDHVMDNLEEHNSFSDTLVAQAHLHAKRVLEALEEQE